MVAYVVEEAWSPWSILLPPGSKWHSLRALDSYEQEVLTSALGEHEDDCEQVLGKVYIIVADVIKARIPARATSPSEEDVELPVDDELLVAVVNSAVAATGLVGTSDPNDGLPQ
jgi:hypothetical protein